MRALLSASLLLTTLLLACQADELGGVEATIERATLAVNESQPDAFANLDVTLELQGRDQPEEVTLSSAIITAQPVTDSSNTLAISARMLTSGSDAIVRLAKSETAVVRVVNDTTTSGELTSWCRLPVELEIVVETADGEEATATSNVTVSCS